MATSESPGLPKETLLRDLRADSDPVLITARVVAAERRDVTRRSDGGRRPVLSGLLSDGTATVRFTWWDPPAAGVERGSVLRAANVVVRDFRGRAEVSFTWKTRVEPASELELPSIAPESMPRRTVSEIAQGSEGFRLDARVVRVRPKVVSVGEERREIHEGILADGTASIAFTAWSDLGLAEGESVRLSGIYARTFRSRPQLILDQRTHVERIPGEGLPVFPADGLPPRTALGELEALGGSDWARVEGVVVDLRPPSGVVYRCPSCRRAVSQGLCRVHGAVEGVADLRARLVLDDGTGSVTVNADRAIAERLWGRTLPEALDALRERPDPERLTEELFTTVFGKRLRAVGRATVDSFGTTLYPDTLSELAPTPPDAASAQRRAP
ncbi:MAG: hypothetical protein L3J93_02555 [Thermoplasmata archaeon]|nr:hypothetical protein [Thermoplasmata archaeon]